MLLRTLAIGALLFQLPASVGTAQTQGNRQPQDPNPRRERPSPPARAQAETDRKENQPAQEPAKRDANAAPDPAGEALRVQQVPL